MRATYASCNDDNSIELAHLLARRVMMDGESLLIVGSPPSTYDAVMRPWRGLVEWRHWPSSEAGRHDGDVPRIPNGVGLVFITKAMSVERMHALQRAVRDQNVNCLFGINSVSVLKRIIGTPPENFAPAKKKVEEPAMPMPPGSDKQAAGVRLASMNGSASHVTLPPGTRPTVNVPAQPAPDDRVTELRRLFQEAHAALDLALGEAERVIAAAATDSAAAKKWATIQEMLKG